jgi:hypothetical protein
MKKIHRFSFFSMDVKAFSAFEYFDIMRAFAVKNPDE